MSVSRGKLVTALAMTELAIPGCASTRYDAAMLNKYMAGARPHNTK